MTHTCTPRRSPSPRGQSMLCLALAWFVKQGFRCVGFLVRNLVLKVRGVPEYQRRPVLLPAEKHPEPGSGV